MKNTHLTALSGLALSIVLLVPSFASANFDSSLAYGMANQSVLELQDFLSEQGCFNHNSTGFFGAITLSAVKCFQERYGIIQTGYFGILSRTQANTLLDSMLAPSISAENDEASTTSAPIVVTPPAPSPKFVYLPSTDSGQQTQNVNQIPVQAVVPTITVTHQGPVFTLQNPTTDKVIKLAGFVFSFTSSDFTAEELSKITTSYEQERDFTCGKQNEILPIGNQACGTSTRGSGKSRFDIRFLGLPQSKAHWEVVNGARTLISTGQIAVTLTAVNIENSDFAFSGVPSSTFHITDISPNEDPNNPGYSIDARE